MANLTDARGLIKMGVLFSNMLQPQRRNHKFLYKVNKYELHSGFVSV